MGFEDFNEKLFLKGLEVFLVADRSESFRNDLLAFLSISV